MTKMKLCGLFRPCDIDADAVLIGETLMRAENKAARLAELRGVL